MRRQSDDAGGDNRQAWSDLLGRAPPRPFGASRCESASGPVNGEPIASNVRDFCVDATHPALVLGATLAGLLALAAGLLLLGATTEIFRDAGPTVLGKKKPFSLGRVQLAWWFFLVVAAFSVIGLVTGGGGT